MDLKLYQAQCESFSGIYIRFLVAKNEEDAYRIAYSMDIFKYSSKKDIWVSEIEIDGYIIKVLETDK